MRDLTPSAAFTAAQLTDICLWRNMGLEWTGIADKYNKKYKEDKSPEAVRHAFRRYGNLYENSNSENYVRHLKEIARTKKTNSKTASENRAILHEMIKAEDLLDDVKLAVAKINKSKVVLPKLKKDKSKSDMTLELLLSDIHYGKKTNEFTLEVCRRRVCEAVKTTLKEIKRNSHQYNVEKVIVALLGDIIESETMHGVESSKGCEMSNSEQIQAAIESLFADVLVPLSATGLDIYVPCVTGNHDRTEKEKTFWHRGKSNVTWVIYNTLKLLCEKSGLKNVRFEIATGNYIVSEIYGDPILWEHGDQAGNTDERTLYNLMAKRSRQVEKVIKFLRMGHFHKEVVYGRGEIIVNGSVPGPDPFSEIHGFASKPGQTLNSYIKTSERPNCFYKSFPIYLK